MPKKIRLKPGKKVRVPLEAKQTVLYPAAIEPIQEGKSKLRQPLERVADIAEDPAAWALRNMGRR